MIVQAMASLDIAGTGQLGARLATALDLIREASMSCSKLDLTKLVAVVNSTASTLQNLSRQDTRLFKSACIHDINALAATCRIIFEGILILMTKRAKHMEEESHEIGQMTREKVEHLFSCMKNKSPLTYNAREWLGPRLKLCEQELKHVNFELVLRFLLGEIAEFQSKASVRSPGDYEKENSMRLSADGVATRRLSYHKRFTKMREDWTKPAEPSPPVESLPEEVKSSASSVTAVPPSPAPETTPPALEATPNVATSPVSEEDDGYSTCSGLTVYPDPSCGERIRRFFSAVFRRSERCEDWEGEDIEAYIINMGRGERALSKLDFEQDAILSGLRKLKSRSLFKKRPELVDQMESLDAVDRLEVDTAIFSMKRQNLQEMTLIAMGVKKITALGKKDSLIPFTPELSLTLYFKVGDKMKPIYVVDPGDTKYTMTYNSCLVYTWMKDSLINLTRFGPYHNFIVNGTYKLYTGKTIITQHNWNSLQRPGMTLKIQISPPPFRPPLGGPMPVPNHVHVPKSPKVTKEVYQEVDKLLKLSRSWTPDAETLKNSGIGHLLHLWTDAIDPDNGDETDDSSIMSWSGSESGSIAD
ncbi:hypothetical protein NW768_002438 [Fusarium equiseti]|uniref:Ubiquitin-like domain-containing protein n=1 Tax=Fusarium equiseti TaxID=61235 RepID=A0ABQ8RNU8_FUSEQ|nr:hypothetical protein NW768_002438 [Fusarium equiseti]